jgi:hypothetical protein
MFPRNVGYVESHTASYHKTTPCIVFCCGESALFTVSVIVKHRFPINVKPSYGLKIAFIISYFVGTFVV